MLAGVPATAAQAYALELLARKLVSANPDRLSGKTADHSSQEGCINIKNIPPLLLLYPFFLFSFFRADALRIN